MGILCPSTSSTRTPRPRKRASSTRRRVNTTWSRRRPYPPDLLSGIIQRFTALFLRSLRRWVRWFPSLRFLSVSVVRALEHLGSRGRTLWLLEKQFRRRVNSAVLWPSIPAGGGTFFLTFSGISLEALRYCELNL